jgi:hypothetical protein
MALILPRRGAARSHGLDLVFPNGLSRIHPDSVKMRKSPFNYSSALRSGRLLAGLILAGASTLAGTLGDGLPADHCMVDGRIDRNLPTVVITHGWRYRNTEFHNPPALLLELGKDIRRRLDEVQPFAPAGRQRVNIVYFLWPAASAPLKNGAGNFFALAKEWFRAGETAQAAGVALASQMRELLGDNYRQPVQFIGHSSGAIVNAFAVRNLAQGSRWRCDVQFTILDAGIGWTQLSDKGFRRLLPDTGPVRVLWVDNYAGIPGVAVGTKLRGAGPGSAFSGGKRVARHHCGVIDYYRETVRDPGRRAGFHYSLLLGNHGGWGGRRPLFWKP